MDLIPREQNPSINYPDDYDPALNGIGGWLVLIIIGRILSIILGIKGIFDITPYIGYDPSADVIAYSSIIFDIIIAIALSGLMLYFIFTRNIAFRIIFLIQFAAYLVYNIFLTVYVSSLGGEHDILYFLVNLIEIVLWLLYLYKSKRVKNTFIYPKLYP